MMRLEYAFCLHFLKTVLLDIRFLVDNFFFFNEFEYVIPLTASSCTLFPRRSQLLIFRFLSCGKVIYSCCFPNFLFVFVFQLTIDLGVDSIVTDLLSIPVASFICGLTFFIPLRRLF